MSRRLRVLLIALGAGVAVVALVVSVLVSGGDDGDDAPAPEAGATTSTTSATPEPAPVVPLAEVDTRTVTVTRDTFCEAVSPDAVTAALDGPATATTEYGDGESVQLTGRVRDISHEFGCSWTTSASGARAWVFAPPVTRRAAAALVREAGREQGCEPVADAPDFGNPSVGLVCRSSRGVEASFRGLFGDAWLTCTVAERGSAGRTGSSRAVVERAEQWCVAVLDASGD